MTQVTVSRELLERVAHAIQYNSYLIEHEQLVEEVRAILAQPQAAAAEEAAVVRGLNRAREQWQAIDPKMCAMKNSVSANFYLIRDAQRDIELLHVALSQAGEVKP